MSRISKMVVAALFVILLFAPSVAHAVTVVANIPSVTNATAARSVQRDWRGNTLTLTRARASAQGVNRHPRNNMLVIIHGINVQFNREVARQTTSVGLGRTGATPIQAGCTAIINNTRFRATIMSNGPASSGSSGCIWQFTGRGYLRRH